jgi:sugar phosphate isomerase/epimerase
MRLGVMASGIAALGWDRALKFCTRLGLDCIEIPCGLYPKTLLLPPDDVLADPARQRPIKDDLARANLQISAIGCAGNPVHPDPDQARRYEDAHDAAIRLAACLGVDVACCFSGCPGGAPGDRTPNWVTCPWPTEFSHMVEYQWADVLVPFWTRKAKEAADLGVKLAFEMHPGNAVYNPETLLRLRAAAGPNVGCNFDPSHLFWQGIEPVEAVRVLGDAGALFHVHAKDCGLDPHNVRVNGVLDTKSYGDLGGRAWVFRTCGYGHGDEFWKPFVSMLRCKGYDGTISVEHEDSYMSGEEGLTKAITYLRGLLIREPVGQAWWF